MVYNRNLKGLNLTQSEKLSGIVSHSEFYKSFIEPQHVSAYWDKSVSTLLVKPEQLNNILNQNKATLYKTDFNIRMLIANLGKKKASPSIISFQIEYLKQDPTIESITIKGNQIEILKKDGQLIRSMVLSKTLDWLSADRLLESSARENKSHEKSMELARNLNSPNTLVTGWVAGLTSKSKYPHSWVETTLDGSEVVIDYTMNAILNKDGYYALRYATPVSKINNAELEKDLELVTPLINNNELSGLEYLVYRDSIIEALKESENE